MNGDIIIRGLVFELDKVNSNGRIYTTEAVENAFSEINSRIIKGETILGELGLPENISIDLQKVVASLVSVDIVGKNAYAALRILKNKLGTTFTEMIENGLCAQINSRGTGIIDEHNKVTDFSIVAFDIAPSEDSRFNVEVKKVETNK